MLKLLVYGYIRESEAVLSKKQMIPNEIRKLCFLYYYESNSLIVFMKMNIFNKLKLTFNEIDQNDISSCKVTEIFESILSEQKTKKLVQTEINENEYQDNKQNKYFYNEYSAVICQRNMKLPINILNQLQIKQNNIGYSYDYNVIFKCGYKSKINRNDPPYEHIPYRECQAFIYNTMDTKQHQFYQWTLPNLPNDISYGMSLVYSSKNGLFSIGGEYRMYKKKSVNPYPYTYKSRESNNDIFVKTSKNIYNLSLFNYNNDDDDDDWNWKFQTKLDYQVGQCVTCIINNYKQIFIAGGGVSEIGRYCFTKKARIYNIETNEIIDVTSSKYARRNMGIYYDKLKKCVYIGGGDNCGPLNKIEYYDLYKNSWIRMTNTNLKHGNYTILWKQYNNINILNIASNINGTMESIDLRDNVNKWIVGEKLKISSNEGRMLIFQD